MNIFLFCAVQSFYEIPYTKIENFHLTREKPRNKPRPPPSSAIKDSSGYNSSSCNERTKRNLRSNLSEGSGYSSEFWRKALILSAFLISGIFSLFLIHFRTCLFTFVFIRPLHVKNITLKYSYSVVAKLKPIMERGLKVYLFPILYDPFNLV